MNIWIEYWERKTTENKNYYAQSQPISWEKLQDQGYHVSVKTDGIL